MTLINGRPLSIRWAAEHVPAIVEAWHPGELGGRAVADVLFGNYDPTGTLHRAQGAWAPQSVKPMLEHYLGKSLDEVEKEYRAFISDIAYKQFGRQWMSRP